MYTPAAKNLMLEALRAAGGITHIGALDADAGKAVTGVAATDVLTSNAHGYANGDLVAFSALNGGAGLVTNFAYFVIGQTANTFQLSRRPGGPAENFATDIAAVSTIARYVELAGGAPAYARKAIAYNAAAEGTMDDSTNGAAIDVPAGATVDAIAQYTAVAAGTLLVFNVVTPEAFAAQGVYTVTDADLDLLATGT